jgi:DNA polymerase I-like protein with 3'-5' exonuclease and polymerase domains
MIGVLYARKDVKITAFSIVYGSGANGLSSQLSCSYDAAYEIKEAYLAAMPGIRSLMRDVQRRGKSGQPIRTWGGRVYYAELSKSVDGGVRDFSYKLLNYLIQGSAADQTKESLCQWGAAKSYASDVSFLATVHDEINISAAQATWKEEMMFLRECMNADRFDVPMLSEGFVGANWAKMEKTE